MLYTFNIAGIHDIGFLHMQFSSNCHFYIRSPFALRIHNVIENMSEVWWNSAEQMGLFT